jgi:hypothetical protein
LDLFPEQDFKRGGRHGGGGSGSGCLFYGGGVPVGLRKKCGGVKKKECCPGFKMVFRCIWRPWLG